jgi:hypothetical protein
VTVPPANIAEQDLLLPEERETLLDILERENRIELHKQWRPSDFYRPHLGGQRQFHRADSIVRCLFPGNGFGKTTAAGNEVNWWMTHSHPFLKTPKWPVIVIWCCETYKQFKILRTQLEAQAFDGRPTFNKVDHKYTWPDGGQLFLVSGDSSWTAIQGINPDLVVFDEQPPEALWNEMKMRRRGMRKTKYVFAATATQGMTWMYRDLYLPWLKLHTDLGLNEQQATRCQWHPRLWVWARGGITDNPGADAGDRDWYASQTFNSDAERAVRMGGGFADFSGQPVFDLSALERAKPLLEDGTNGRFVRVPAVNADDPRAMTITEKDGKTWRALLAWQEDGIDQLRGRITLFRQPRPGAKYVIGHDSAYGLLKGDFDYAVVWERDTGEQVGEAQGHWGATMWPEVLWGLAWHFNQAFLCGERQVGLFTMRRLYDEMGYSYQYLNRDDETPGRTPSEKLGHHRRAGDQTIPRLRTAIGRRLPTGELTEPEVIVRSRELWRQMVKFQYRSKKTSMEIHECHDDELVVGAPRGDYDDGVLAAGYGVMGLSEVAKFQDQERPYAAGSFGAVLHQGQRPGMPNRPTPHDVDGDGSGRSAFRRDDE